MERLAAGRKSASYFFRKGSLCIQHDEHCTRVEFEHAAVKINSVTKYAKNTVYCNSKAFSPEKWIQSQNVGVGFSPTGRGYNAKARVKKSRV